MRPFGPTAKPERIDAKAAALNAPESNGAQLLPLSYETSEPDVPTAIHIFWPGTKTTAER